MAPGRLRDWVVTFVLVAVAAGILFFLALMFAIWVIATQVPALGPVVVLTAVSVVVSLIGSAATVTLALVARSTFREARQKSERDFAFEQMKGLYSPLYHVVKESGGKLYDIFEAPPPSLVSSIAQLRTYWLDRIIPLMRQGLHLATPELAKVYWRMQSSEPSEALAKEFSDQVTTDFERLRVRLDQTSD